MTWMRWCFLLALLTAGAGAAFAPKLRNFRLRPAPTYIEVAVSRGPVEFSVNSTGTVKPVRSVSIGSFVSGPIAELHADFNSVVQQGDLLARIDPRLLQANVDRDRASLAAQQADRARVQAELSQARRNEERTLKLREIRKDYLSDAEMDQFHFARLVLEARLQLVESSVAQAAALLKNSEANLEYTEIRAPVSGTVIERKVDLGQTVASQFQTPELFVLAPDMSQAMHIFANVDEADIGLIRNAQERGFPAFFSVDAYPEQLFEGKILQIRRNSTTLQNVVTYPVLVETTNPELKLLPGMTANLSFQIDCREDVLRIPTSALRFVPDLNDIHPADRKYLLRDDQNTQRQQPSARDKVELSQERTHRLVWALEEQELHAIPITVGLIDDQFAEVTGGDLRVDQRIVVGIETSRQGVSGP